MQKIKSASAITLALISFNSYAIPGLAKPTAVVSNVANSAQLRFTAPPLPPTGTPIGRRRGAAGRKCALAQPLTALVPATEQSLGEGKVNYVWGKTSAEYPTFWFYVPDTHTSLNSVEFVLQDEQDNDLYRTRVSLPKAPGVVSLQLPSTATPLKVNQKYHWFFKIAGEVSCDRQNPSLFKDSVEGWVQRVKPDPTFISQLEAATPQQRVVLYARNGFWYDALTTLAELRLMQPGDANFKADWNGLLQSVGLSNVAAQPIVRCCTPENNN